MVYFSTIPCISFFSRNQWGIGDQARISTFYQTLPSQVYFPVISVHFVDTNFRVLALDPMP